MYLRAVALLGKATRQIGAAYTLGTEAVARLRVKMGHSLPAPTPLGQEIAGQIFPKTDHNANILCTGRRSESYG